MNQSRAERPGSRCFDRRDLETIAESRGGREERVTAAGRNPIDVRWRWGFTLPRANTSGWWHDHIDSLVPTDPCHTPTVNLTSISPPRNAGYIPGYSPNDT